VIVAVPAVRPLTSPDELTVATEGVLLLHVPPGVASDKVIDKPVHTVPGPVIGAVAKDTIGNMAASKRHRILFILCMLCILRQFFKVKRWVLVVFIFV
jgi:hypothetical protein